MNALFIALGSVLAVVSIIFYIVYRKSRNYSLHTVSAVIMIAAVLMFSCYFLEVGELFKEKATAPYTEYTVSSSYKYYQQGRPIKKTTTNPESDTQQGSTYSGKVYITRNGTKYHYDINCGDYEFYECTLEQAISRNLEPCKRCIKQ